MFKNIHFGEYLHTAPNDVAADPRGKRIFTWMGKADGPASNWGKTLGEKFEYQGIWHLSKTNATCDGCYAIKSAYSRDSASEKLYNTKIETVPGFPDRQRLKIEINGQYRFGYASFDSNGENRRYVYVWGPDEEKKIDTLGGLRDWSIEKVDCPPYII